MSSLIALVFAFTSAIVVSPSELFAAPIVEAPVASPAGLKPQGTTDLLVTLRIVRAPTDPAAIGEALYLYRVNESNKNIHTYGRMYDDGTNGDAVAGDDVFSLRISVSQPPPEGIRIQASVPFMRVLRRSISPITHIPVDENQEENLPPVFKSEPLTEGVKDRVYYYEVKAEDPEGGEVEIELEEAPEDMILYSSELLRWVPRAHQVEQQFPVVLKATDPQGASTMQSFTLQVRDFNEPPIITSLPPRQAKEGELYSYDVKAYDPEGTILTYSLDEAPEGMTIGSTSGEIRWTPGELSGENPQVIVRVTDEGSAFTQQTYNLEVTGEPLVLLKPTDYHEVFAGETLELDLEANYERASFRVTPMPENGSIPPGTKKFRFKPTLDQVGLYNLSFETVFAGMRDAKPVLIVVHRLNHPPELEEIPAQNIQQGQQLFIPVTASDPDGEKLTFSLPDSNIANLFFDEVQSRIIFMPDFTQSGDYTFTLRVSDGKLSDEKTVTIQVEEINEPVVQTLDLVVDPIQTPNFRTTVPISGSVIGEARAPEFKPLALITGVTPASVYQGREATIDITGYNTNFSMGTTEISFGDGISVKSFQILSPVSARAEIEAEIDAEPGLRNIVVKQNLEEIPSVIAFELLESASQIRGVLVDDFTTQPIENARIVANGTGAAVKSDAGGVFHLEGLPDGNHTLVITRSNYEVFRRDIALTKNQVLDLGTLPLRALARPFVPSGSLPRAATVASVIDRGLGSLDVELTLDQAKALVLDTVLAIPGTEYGAIDEAGNQLNPNMIGPGSFSLTPTGVEQHALAVMEGTSYQLSEVLDALTGSFGWVFGGELTPEVLLSALQHSVDKAWANPADPYNALPIMIFNEGTVLQSQAPILSLNMRLTHMQSFLLASSFMTHFAPLLDLAFEKLYEHYNLELPRVETDPVTGETLIHMHGQVVKAEQSGVPAGHFGQAITVASAGFSDLLLGGAVYANDADPNGSSDTQGRSPSQGVWDTVFVPELKDLAVGAVIALAFIVLGKMLFGFLTVGIAATTLGGAGAILMATAAAVAVGLLFSIISRAATAFFAPSAVASLRPPPPTGIVHARTAELNKVFIRFKKDPTHVRQTTSPDDLYFPRLDTLIDMFGPGVNLKLLEFEYQLWKFSSPLLTNPRLPGAQLISTNAHELSFIQAPGSPAVTPTMEFVVPISRLEDGSSNIFRIRTVIYYRGYLATPPEEFETAITLEELGVEMPATIPTTWKTPLSITNSVGAATEVVDEFDGRIETAKEQHLEQMKNVEGPRVDNEIIELEKKKSLLKSEQAVYQNYVDEATRDIEAARAALTVQEKADLGRYAKANTRIRSHIDGGGAVADFLDPDSFVSRNLIADLGGPANYELVKAEIGPYAADYAKASSAQRALKLQMERTTNIANQKAALQKSIQNNTGSRILSINYETVDPLELDNPNPKPQKVVRRLAISGDGSVIDFETGQSTTLQAELAAVELAEVQQKARLETVKATHNQIQAEGAIKTSENNFKSKFMNNERIQTVVQRIRTAQEKLRVSSLRRDRQKINIAGRSIEQQNKIRAHQNNAAGLGPEVRALNQQKLTVNKSTLGRMASSKPIRALNSNAGQGAIAAVTAVGDTAWGIRERIKVLPSPFSDPYVLTRNGDSVEIEGPPPPPQGPRIGPAPAFNPGEPPPITIYPREHDTLAGILSELNPFTMRPAFAQTPPLVIPPHFETDPDEFFDLAFLSVFKDPDNPKNGFLGREFPFTGPRTTLASTGFPADFIATDSKGAVYLINKNSQEKFGGRVFRFYGDPAARELIGTMNYYSLTLQITRGVSPAAMDIADFKDPNYEDTVENLFIANKEDGIFMMSGAAPPPNRILRIPVHLADRHPAYQNGQNRDRIVGQVYATHEEFKFTGPSDMERDARVRTDPTAPPRPFYLSDETNIFAVVPVPGTEHGEVVKIVSIPGRRWSGLAMDANGNLLFADYNGGELFLLPADELDSIVTGGGTINSNGALDERAYLLKVGLDRPGDVELDTLQERYVVSTPNGYEAFDLVLIGRYSPNVLEIHSDVLGVEAPVTLRPGRGNVFIVGVATEGELARRVRLRIKTLNPETNQGVWDEKAVHLEPFGATILKETLQ